MQVKKEKERKGREGRKGGLHKIHINGRVFARLVGVGETQNRPVVVLIILNGDGTLSTPIRVERPVLLHPDICKGEVGGGFPVLTRAGVIKYVSQSAHLGAFTLACSIQQGILEARIISRVRDFRGTRTTPPTDVDAQSNQKSHQDACPSQGADNYASNRASAQRRTTGTVAYRAR